MVIAARLQLAMLVASLVWTCNPASAQSSSDRSAAELMDAVMWNREPIGGHFELIDQHGTRRTEMDFRGRLMLVYFGFTFCADVCPTDLMQMTLALEQLGEAGARVQPIFITVDPERDTPEHLREYLIPFHPRFLGLSGEPSAIEAASRAYRVYFNKVERPDGSDYTLDHSAFIYLIGRDGEYLGFFPPSTDAERLAETLGRYLRERP